MSRTETERLIEAGAIVALGVEGDTVDAVTARRYRHPALVDRVVVTLVPETLGAAEDLALEFLGFEPETVPVVVGSGRRQALGFPAWAVINDPANGHHALALVKDIERLARLARSKPGQAKEGFEALGARLGSTVPHFLPTFYEQAGRAFVATDNRSMAATMFGKAREAERVHALEVDEDRQRDVFLEFAFAGALTAKSLTQHAKDLSLRAEPEAAYELFLRICRERVAGGLPPYAGMADDLRRLARVAKLPAAEQDDRVITTLLDSPALPHAPLAFWKAYSPALVRRAATDVAIRARLLDLLPVSEHEDTETVWFDLLTDSGALAGLIEVDDTAEIARPHDGAAGWLGRVVRWRFRGWRGHARSSRLLALVERMAPRLRAEKAEIDVVPAQSWRPDLDLLDLCLALGLPVTVHTDLRALSLESWLEDGQSGRRDLVALAGAGWARESLMVGVGHMIGRRSRGDWRAEPPKAMRESGIRVLMESAGAREILRAWLDRIAADAEAGALPGLEEALDQLAPLAIGSVLGLSPAARARLSGLDVGRALARTLRIGLFGELAWPALEQAAEEFPIPKPPVPQRGVTPPPVARFEIHDAWPALILSTKARVSVVGPDAVLLRHDIRMPKAHPVGYNLSVDYVDGQVLVCWYSGGGLGYWSDHPDDVFDVRTDAIYRYRGAGAGQQPLPGGGRTTGGRPLRPGDTTFAPLHSVVGDGEHWWRQEGAGWQEYDPQTGNPGRRSRPAFFEAALARGDEAVLLDDLCRLAPVQPGQEGSLLGVADGLLGWRAVQLPDGSRRGESVTGAVVTMSADLVRQWRDAGPAGVVQWPGGAPVSVLSSWPGLSLMVGETVGSMLSPGLGEHAYARGAVVVPDLDLWPALRPRDEAGSAVLRAITDAQASELLRAGRQVVDPDQLDQVIRRVLPGITDPRLITDVAGVLALAVTRSEQIQALPEAVETSISSPAPASAPAVPDGWYAPALAGLTDTGVHWSSPRSNEDTRGSLKAVVQYLRTPSPPGTLFDLPASGADWTALVGGLAAVAWRVATAATPPDDQRPALIALLTAAVESGLGEPDGHWRVVELSIPRSHAVAPGYAIDTATGRAVVLSISSEGWQEGRQESRALEYSPSGEFGVVPEFSVLSSRPSGGWGGVERITELLELVRIRGPVPWRPEAVDALVTATGMSRPEATMLLAGLPGGQTWEHNFLDPHTRTTIGIKVAEASAAQPLLARIAPNDRLRLLELGLRDRLADLWELGPDVEAMAAGWVQRFGRRVAVPEQLTTELATLMKEFGYHAWGAGRLSNVADPSAALILQAVADPAGSPWLSQDRTWTIEDDRVTVSGEGFHGSALIAAVAALAWLAYRLAPDDPFRARLGPAHEALRQRLAHPTLLVPLRAAAETSGLRQIYGHPAPKVDITARLGSPGILELGRAGVLEDRGGSDSVYARPALLDGRDDPLLKAGEGQFDPVAAALRLLSGPDLARLIEGDGGSGWAQDPLVSVPGLVPAVANRLGVETDAARLYLQLLALPDPTDKNVARWNGWTAKYLKTVTAQLRSAGVVVDGKRARAGRSVFLPGGWLDVKAPFPPIEVWKVALLELLPDGRGPLGVTVPTVPVGELFHRAWQRVEAGDGPRLEQFGSGPR